MPITIHGIDHVVLRTRDADAMRRFYCEVLGCTVEREQPELGLVQLRAGCSLIDLVRAGGPIDRPDSGSPGAGRNMDHLCLAIDPFDATALGQHLAAHGVQAGEVVERYGAQGYGPSLYLFDPDGNMVELKGPPRAV